MGLPVDHRLPGIDPDAHSQIKARVPRIQLVDRLQDPQAGAHRTLGVVLARDRRPEHGHYRVADELLHRPAVPLELEPHPLVIRPQPRSHILRISRLRRRRETDEVAEENGHDLPLHCHRRGLRLG